MCDDDGEADAAGAESIPGRCSSRQQQQPPGEQLRPIASYWRQPTPREGGRETQQQQQQQPSQDLCSGEDDDAHRISVMLRSLTRLFLGLALTSIRACVWKIMHLFWWLLFIEYLILDILIMCSMHGVPLEKKLYLKASLGHTWLHWFLPRCTHVEFNHYHVVYVEEKWMHRVLANSNVNVVFRSIPPSQSERRTCVTIPEIERRRQRGKHDIWTCRSTARMGLFFAVCRGGIIVVGRDRCTAARRSPPACTVRSSLMATGYVRRAPRAGILVLRVVFLFFATFACIAMH